MVSVGRDPILDQRRKVGGFLRGQLFKLAEKIGKVRSRARDGRHSGFNIRGHDSSPAGGLGLLGGFFCDCKRQDIKLLLEFLQGVRGDPEVGVRLHKGFNRVGLCYAYRFCHFQRSSIGYTGFRAVWRLGRFWLNRAKFSLLVRYILTELGRIVKGKRKDVL